LFRFHIKNKRKTVKKQKEGNKEKTERTLPGPARRDGYPSRKEWELGFPVDDLRAFASLIDDFGICLWLAHQPQQMFGTLD
jgi:hypothetical protein